MNHPKLVSFFTFIWISLILCLIGWGGLVVLVIATLPTLGPRWSFFFLLTLALSGTALPVAYFLNRRFPTDPPADSSMVLRESMWFGVYGSLLAWLQMGRVLNTGLALVLGVGLVLVEFLLRLSERSQWSPGRNAPVTDPASGDEEEEEDEDEEEDE